MLEFTLAELAMGAAAACGLCALFTPAVVPYVAAGALTIVFTVPPSFAGETGGPLTRWAKNFRATPLEIGCVLVAFTGIGIGDKANLVFEIKSGLALIGVSVLYIFARGPHTINSTEEIFMHWFINGGIASILAAKARLVLGW